MRRNQPKGFINPTVVEERSRNITQLDIFSRLIMERIVFIDGEINPEVASIVVGQLLYLDSISNDTIYIYINSEGGAVYAGMAIYDVMKTLHSKIVTVCVGMAASMGGILFLAGHERKILKHSRVMFHQLSGGVSGKFSELYIYLKEAEKDKEILYNIIKEVTLIADPETECSEDSWYDAEECIKLNIATEIYGQ